MNVTVFLETPIEDEHKIECAEARMIGDIVWTTPDGDGQQLVVPLSNVTGVAGDDVEQEIEDIEYPGGRVNELVTCIS